MGHPVLSNSTRLRKVGDHLLIGVTSRRCAYCITAKNQKRSTIVCIKVKRLNV
jgi:hypothetical protein